MKAEAPVASSSTTEAQAPASSSSATESSTQQTTETTTPSTDNSATENTGSSSSEQPVQPTTPSDNGNNGGQTGGGTVTPTPEPTQRLLLINNQCIERSTSIIRFTSVVWDAGLAASATARAAQVEAGGIPNDHWSRGDEVIAIMWAPGNSVIMAWYNETNMVTASGSGHRDWEINPGITRVGFGYSGSTIVGHSA